MKPEDRWLAELVRESHALDPTAPRLERLLERPREVRRWVLAPVATAVVLVALGVVGLRSHQEQQARRFAREIASWRAPSDALLAPVGPTNPLRHRSRDLLSMERLSPMSLEDTLR